MYMPLAAVPVWLSFGILPLLLEDPNSRLGHCRIALSAHRALHHDDSAHGFADAAVLAVAVSIGLLVLSIWGVLWFSSRLYRVGILMYGKRATLPELLRWLRYS
jgi:ABC-2 type transport system permease protein